MPLRVSDIDGPNGTTVIVDTYAELPDPTTLRSGVRVVVTNDPSVALCGEHIAMGPVTGNATHYLKQ